jgi:hypothetical protein
MPPPELAAWGVEAETFEPPDVLGRHEGAMFLERKARSARGRERRRLQRQAVRLRLTGSTQRPLGSWRRFAPLSGRPRRREHRACRRTTHRAARAGASRDGPDPPEPEPPGLAVTWLAAFRRELLHALGGAA